MGGKRPDQYRIDPAEAGATDYKFRAKDRRRKQEPEIHHGPEEFRHRTKKGQPVKPVAPAAEEDASENGDGT